MAKRVSSGHKKTFDLGGGQAETDWLLQDAFYETAEFDAIDSRDDRRCFVIGRTGGGKSAALRQLELERSDHVIRINPEDLSLPYITDLGVIQYLDSLDVHLDNLFIALWKHVLLVEIIRHRYNVDSMEAKKNMLHALREKLRPDPSKVAALEYLDEFEGKFWYEADERVREITHKFEDTIDAEIKAHYGLPGVAALSAGGVGGSVRTREERAEQAARFQRIVNATQLARLNKMIGVLNEYILDDQHFTYVVIDDLDREWVDRRIANDLILFLFRTVQDLVSKVENLKVLVALRTNIFEQLNFSSKAGAQEEKLRGLVLNIHWSRKDLENMLDQRVRTAAERAGRKYENVRQILPPYKGHRRRPNPIDYVLDRTLLRPRDAIAFLNQCIRAGSGKHRLTWDDIYKAEQVYSRDRLLALRDEWKDTYPGVADVFEVFRRTEMPMSRSDFTSCIEEIMLLPAKETFTGTVWMTEISRTMMSGTGDLDWVELFQPITHLLYRIGFIGCRTRRSSRSTYFHHDPGFTSVASNLDESCWFEVHPAFHSALDLVSRGGGITSSEGANDSSS